MTNIVFKEMGYRRLISPNILNSVIDYLNKTDLGEAVTLDLRGCVFSYTLARVLEAVVLKFDMTKNLKSLTLIHGYSIAIGNHLVPYLTKKVDILGKDITTIEELKKSLLSHNINLEIIGSNDE